MRRLDSQWFYEYSRIGKTCDDLIDQAIIQPIIYVKVNLPETTRHRIEDSEMSKRKASEVLDNYPRGMLEAMVRLGRLED